MPYTDDPIADAEEYFDELERELKKYPVCDYCDKRITEDKYFDIDGELYHFECLCEQFQKNTEDYIE